MEARAARRGGIVDALQRVCAETYWSLAANAPLLREEGASFKLKVTPPGDLRPSVGYHYRLVAEVIEQYFGSPSDAWRTLPRRKIVLANKIPYPDHAEEIIVDGQVVGHIIYSLVGGGRRWRFKPLYLTVRRMIEEKTGYYAVVDLPKLRRGYVVKRSALAEKHLPEGRDEYIALATLDGRYFGVGALLRGERIYILKSWLRRAGSFHELDPDLQRAVRLNEDAVREMEEEAIKFVQDISSKYQKPVVVSLSGGKDSLATLNIAVKALGPEKVTALFNDTGIEFPETVEYVHRIAEKFGVELILASAGEAFWKAVEVFGPPARDYRWCCKVTKLAPIARILKERFPNGVLSLVGQRKYESAARALSPRVWRNAWLPNVIAASPIHDWTALAVWLYIYREKLPVNKLYFLGFDRLGCWLCPAVELAELDLLEKWKPDLSLKWRSYLESFATKAGLRREWVSYGLWRWISPPKDILRFVKVEEVKSRDAASKVEVISSELLRVTSGSGRVLDPSRLLNLLATDRRLSKAVSEITPLEGGLLVRLSKPLEGADEITDFERVVVRAYDCVGCLECANWCPAGAIAPDPRGGIRVDGQRCTGCGVCNLKCPLGEYVVKLRASRRARGAE